MVVSADRGGTSVLGKCDEGGFPLIWLIVLQCLSGSTLLRCDWSDKPDTFLVVFFKLKDCTVKNKQILSDLLMRPVKFVSQIDPSAATVPSKHGVHENFASTVFSRKQGTSPS